MTEKEQRDIFAKNLNYYLALNNKLQIDLAKDLGMNASTINMWCKGKSMPSVGKIQTLADYFRIGKSDLTDNKSFKNDNSQFGNIIAKISMNDERFKNIIIAYYNLPAEKKESICDFFEKLIL